MIRLENVHKYFDDRHVLKGINATFLPGTVNMIIGASGGGKSVTLKCMVGLEEPDSGTIWFGDRDFHHMDYNGKQSVRREIGMLFQGTALFDSLTVEENVAFPLRMFSDLQDAEIKDRVNHCLERVNLPGINSKFPGEISGGMKKRVGIARAIALNIQYLFCDEPNSGLDPLTSRVIDELILEITKEYGITTVINSHDMKTVLDIGENIVFMYQGEARWAGSGKEVVQGRKDVPELDEFFKASF